MSIDTGGFITGASSMCNDGGGPAQGTNAVLFDPNSSYAQSPLIVVREKSSVLLVGYNIPEGAVLTVEGVSVGSRSVAQGYGCCSPNNALTGASIYNQRAADILFRSPMKLGGKVWQLTKDIDRLLIPLPGNYLLVLNDTAYLGDMQVEMIPQPEVPQMPFAYMAGI